MKPSVRFTIIAIVVVAVVAIVVSKYRARPERATPVVTAAPAGPPPAAPRAEAPAAPLAARASVLLFADLREADEEEDRCGNIIRAVRATREHGVNVTEYDSGASPDVRKQHRVVVEPTIIVLDASGREVARHEGEDDATMQAILDQMARLSGDPA